MNQHTQTESEPRDGTFNTNDNHFYSEVVPAVRATIFNPSKTNEEAIQQDRKLRYLSQSSEKKVEENDATLDELDTDAGFENPEVFTK